MEEMEEKDIVTAALEWIAERNLHPISELAPLNVIELIDREGFYVLMRKLSRRTGLTEGFALYELREGSVLVLVRLWKYTRKNECIAYTAFAAFMNELLDDFKKDDYMIKYDDDFKEVPK